MANGSVKFEIITPFSYICIKQLVEVRDLKFLSFFLLLIFASACERISTKIHSIKSRFVTTGP